VRGAELKQELQVRQKTIHDTPDNEKTAEKSMDENEKSDPTKSPEAPFGSNKMPSSTPLKMPVTESGITQAARHSALNIVGDLLRRVGVNCNSCAIKNVSISFG